MRKLAAALLMLLTASIASVAIAGPAAAHDELLSTTPANGAVLVTAPETLVLRFEDAPLAGSAKVVASAQSGEQVALPDPSVTGSVVAVAWPAGTAPGTYTVNWRNVGADGHPLTGTFGFSYSAARTASPTISAAAASPPGAPTDSGSSNGSTWIWVTLVAVIIIAAGLATITIARRGSNR